MKISGPHRDRQRGNWYLSYSEPKLGANGSPLMKEGRVVLKRHRPHYDSAQLAEADKPRIRGQFGTSGGGDFVHSRAAQSDYS
ncbi:MAG: hypothetical protein JWQ83_656, partial [Lacunisphaera sp.]|nr:hypothetical protein [Lacunisphaera sp.]